MMRLRDVGPAMRAVFAKSRWTVIRVWDAVWSASFTQAAFGILSGAALACAAAGFGSHKAASRQSEARYIEYVLTGEKPFAEVEEGPLGGKKILVLINAEPPGGDLSVTAIDYGPQSAGAAVHRLPVSNTAFGALEMAAILPSLRFELDPAAIRALAKDQKVRVRVIVR